MSIVNDIDAPLTVQDVMRRLGFQKADPIYALLKSGQLIGHAIRSRVGGSPRWRIYPAALAAYLESTRNSTTRPARTPKPKSKPAAVAPLPYRFIDRTRRITLPPSTPSV